MCCYICLLFLYSRFHLSLKTAQIPAMKIIIYKYKNRSRACRCNQNRIFSTMYQVQSTARPRLAPCIRLCFCCSHSECLNVFVTFYRARKRTQVIHLKLIKYYTWYMSYGRVYRWAFKLNIKFLIENRTKMIQTNQCYVITGVNLTECQWLRYTNLTGNTSCKELIRLIVTKQVTVATN